MAGKTIQGVQYLLWFDGQIAGRQVILLIDGFSAHHAGLNLLYEEPPRVLIHAKVKLSSFLLTPPLLSQPLD